MESKHILILWVFILTGIFALVGLYMSWCKEYDSKITSIVRNEYLIRLDKGRCFKITEDEKTMEKE